MLLPATARADPALAASVRIHVESTGPVRVERMAPGDVEWRAVCTSPCDVLVRADGVFRAAGDDVRPSPPFVVHAGPGERVDVRVQPSSKTVHSLGIVGIVGGSLVATGALTVAAGQWLAAALQGIGSAIGAMPCAVLPSPRCTTPPPTPASPNYTPAFVTAALAGAITLAGAVALALDGHTRVEGSSIESAPEPPTPPSEWIRPDEAEPTPVAVAVGFTIRF
jgi:hypothetical protein